MDQLKEIMNGVVMKAVRDKYRGGQSCGMPKQGCIVSHPDYDISIMVKECRSDYENKILALLLFELAIKEIFKL